MLDIISKYKNGIEGDNIFTITRLGFILVMSAIILILNFRNIIEMVQHKFIGNDKVKSKSMDLLFKLYMIILISLVFFPIPLAHGDNIVEKFPNIHLIPWESTIGIYKKYGIFDVIINLGGNLVLLTPLIFFICYKFSIMNLNIKCIIIISLCSSLLIESTQVTLSLIIPNLSRTFDTIDLICNTISGLLGYYLYIGINYNRIYKKSKVHEDQRQCL